MRQYKKQLTVFFLFCAFLVRLCSLADDRPNILFFITDDESWLERSVYGWSKLPTPHIDRVAKDGILFTHGYTSAPSCAPSRAVCLTGRNFWELEQGSTIQAWLPKKFPVVPDLLAAGGYLVGSTGKGWGPGVYPPQGHKDPTGKRYNKLLVDKSKRIKYISSIDYVANFEVFLKEKKKDQPFYFWMGTLEPHAPYDKENYKRLEKEYGFTLDDVSVPGFIEDTPANRKKRANFLYECCYADVQLGKALKLLEDIGELDNTLVIVTSDNGTAIGDHGKATPYDWSCREPLAVMWPKKIPAGRTVTDFVSFRDFAPTMLDVAGLNIPGSMTGSSLLPILLSNKSGRIEAARDHIVHGLEWHGEFDPVSRSHRTYRNDRFAFIRRYANKLPAGRVDPPDAELASEELYDIKKDPWQQNNLMRNPEYASIADNLRKKLRSATLNTKDPRSTGDMTIIRETRNYVQERKRNGYKKWGEQ